MVFFALSILEQHVVIWTGVITSLSGMVIGLKKLNRKADEIHVLVNSNLQKALQEIEDLKTKLKEQADEKEGNDPGNRPLQ